jgi:hypothetical protein
MYKLSDFTKARKLDFISELNLNLLNLKIRLIVYSIETYSRIGLTFTQETYSRIGLTFTQETEY